MAAWLHGIRHDAVSGKREDRKMLEKKRAKTLKIELNRIELNRIVLNWIVSNQIEFAPQRWKVFKRCDTLRERDLWPTHTHTQNKCTILSYTHQLIVISSGRFQVVMAIDNWNTGTNHSWSICLGKCRSHHSPLLRYCATYVLTIKLKATFKHFPKFDNCNNNNFNQLAPELYTALNAFSATNEIFNNFSFFWATFCTNEMSQQNLPLSQ